MRCALTSPPCQVAVFRSRKAVVANATVLAAYIFFHRERRSSISQGCCPSCVVTSARRTEVWQEALLGARLIVLPTLSVDDFCLRTLFNSQGSSAHCRDDFRRTLTTRANRWRTCLCVCACVRSFVCLVRILLGLSLSMEAIAQLRLMWRQ